MCEIGLGAHAPRGHGLPATGYGQSYGSAYARPGYRLRATRYGRNIANAHALRGYRLPATGYRQKVTEAQPLRGARSRLALVALAFAFLTSTAAADDVQTLLAAADAYRLAHESAKVETEVVSMKHGAVQKERRYTVFQRADRRSLVLMRSPAEQGQKVLMLADDYWLILPKTQRPVRITPTQKLLGEASTGDIATMRWAGDYTGQVVGVESCGDTDAGDCTHLSLQAARKGTTYARVELWLSAANRAPVRADLYLASDKLAKRARFVLAPGDDGLAVSEMQLIDEIQAGRTTVVRYLSRMAHEAPLEWFNPMFLTRSEPGS